LTSVLQLRPAVRNVAAEVTRLKNGNLQENPSLFSVGDALKT
jgi:hypothetical protein